MAELLASLSFTLLYVFSKNLLARCPSPHTCRSQCVLVGCHNSGEYHTSCDAAFPHPYTRLHVFKLSELLYL